MFCLSMRESHTDLWILHRLFNLKGSFENSKKKLRDSVSLYSTMPKTSRRQCLVVCNNGESFKRKLRDSVSSCLTMAKAIPYQKKEPFEEECHPSGLRQRRQKKWCSLTLESFDNDDLWRRLRKALKFWVLLKTLELWKFFRYALEEEDSQNEWLLRDPKPFYRLSNGLN